MEIPVFLGALLSTNFSSKFHESATHLQVQSSIRVHRDQMRGFRSPQESEAMLVEDPGENHRLRTLAIRLPRKTNRDRRRIRDSCEISSIQREHVLPENIIGVKVHTFIFRNSNAETGTGFWSGDRTSASKLFTPGGLPDANCTPPRAYVDLHSFQAIQPLGIEVLSLAKDRLNSTQDLFETFDAP